jgi:hypothetical protein
MHEHRRHRAGARTHEVMRLTALEQPRSSSAWRPRLRERARRLGAGQRVESKLHRSRDARQPRPVLHAAPTPR